VFPLPGAAAAAAGQAAPYLRPRYLRWDDALRDGLRLIGMNPPYFRRSKQKHSLDGPGLVLFGSAVAAHTRLAESGEGPLHPRNSPAVARFKVVSN